MANFYILIPRIKVSDCNLEASHLSVCFPMMSLAGMIEHIRFQAKHRYRLSLTISQFLPLLIDYQVYQGMTKNPLSTCKGNGGKPAEKDLINPPIIPEIKGKVEFSLIMKVNSNSTIENIQSMLCKILDVARFAGGHIFHYGAPCTYANLEELLQQLTTHPFSWAISDRSDLLSTKDEKGKMYQLIEAVAMFHSEEDNTYHRKQKGWIFAMPNGYQMLEAPTQRPGTRPNQDGEYYNHAFCEPTHTLAELVPISRLYQRAKAGQTDHEIKQMKVFWKQVSDVENRRVMITTN
ncbi:MAG: hypothetical protein OEZ58_18565 [Gammaproteobacteria bacterium]|nr:hypothetical protein [Gammaproteobacteria bacterium]MDH5730995.1 hypothetical protein [Gammaproteobacteria bacterium]